MLRVARSQPLRSTRLGFCSGLRSRRTSSDRPLPACCTPISATKTRRISFVPSKMPYTETHSRYRATLDCL